jgi:enoyl-CoA hydratase
MAWQCAKILRDTGMATITLKRPEVHNALNKTMIEEIRMMLSVVEAMGDVNVLIFTGDGDRAFSVGADIKEMAEMDADGFEQWLLLNQHFFDQIANLKAPTIAALNGYTLGGGLELALACDLRIAKEDIQLGLPEARLGVIPGTGGTQRLARLVGPGIAKDLILTGRRIKADEALRLGLVSRVIPADQWPQAVYDLAKEMAALAPLSVRASKKCINAADVLGLQEGLDLERELNLQCFRSEDFREGLTAFKEKRPPIFRGR